MSEWIACTFRQFAFELIHVVTYLEGYQYRLCPASEPLTEACFQDHVRSFIAHLCHSASAPCLIFCAPLTLSRAQPLEFATPKKHTVVYKDHSIDINATLVTEGT
jgi:hypothetical protein